VGITGLTTAARDGTPAHACHAHRRDCQANPIKAGGVRQWPGTDDGLGGTPVCVTNAPVDQPWRPCDDDDDRRLIDICCLKEATPPWDLGHPPQNTARAVRVHGRCTRLLFARATADRLPGERQATGGEPVGWPRWRRQLLEQTRDQVIVCAPGYGGLCHLAEYALLLGVKRNAVPPGIGTRQEIRAKYRLTMRR
jgi:hypothetical protein